MRRPVPMLTQGERIATLEARSEQVDERFTSFGKRFDKIETILDELHQAFIRLKGIKFLAAALLTIAGTTAATTTAVLTVARFITGH